MAMTKDTTRERARSRGTEGSVVLIVALGSLVAAAVALGTQLSHLLGGVAHVMP